MRLTIVHLHTLGAGSGFTHSSFWEPVLSKMWTLLVPPFGNTANAILYSSNHLFLSWGGDTWLPTTTKTLFQHMMSYLVPIDSLLGMTSLEMKDDVFCEFALNWYARKRVSIYKSLGLFHYYNVLTPILKTCFGLDTEQTYKKGSGHSFHSEAIWRWWWLRCWWWWWW